MARTVLFAAMRPASGEAGALAGALVFESLAEIRTYTGQVDAVLTELRSRTRVCFARGRRAIQKPLLPKA